MIPIKNQVNNFLFPHFFHHFVFIYFKIFESIDKVADSVAVAVVVVVHANQIGFAMIALQRFLVRAILVSSVKLRKVMQKMRHLVAVVVHGDANPIGFAMGAA